MAKKTHLYKSHGDHRSAGQTQYEYSHSTACGYVRGSVTNYAPMVTCKHCIREIKKLEAAKQGGESNAS